MTTNSASLPYEEPGIVAVLILSSFLVLLNVINSVLDRLLYCGLIGQVLIGIAWGTPGAKWISYSAEEAVIQLGYIGLILLVYEGGLSTSFTSLKANLLLSIAVALTGIAVPIALSFSLRGLVRATSLQAFAAGAALCSTSLGTTFTVLSTSGLTMTRLGVVLTSAAMMDDVVGLVMVQVISNLRGSRSSINPTTIVRPILVSLAFAVVLPLTCKIFVKPLTLLLNHRRENNPLGVLQRVLCLRQTVFVIHTAILLGLVTGASYAGASTLFAAYIAGAIISWWDSELPHVIHGSTAAAEASPSQGEGNIVNPSDGQVASKEVQPENAGDGTNGSQHGPGRARHEMPTPTLDSSKVYTSTTSGSAVYEHYYQQPVERILKPFFFASIGFSIPITRMFSGSVVWRGIVYALLMTFGKLVCGLWLVRFSIAPLIPNKLRINSFKLPALPHLCGKRSKREGRSNNPSFWSALSSTLQQRRTSVVQQATPKATSLPRSRSNHQSPKPLSLYPASMLGIAMVARGEIGFLISAVAESNDIFGSPSTGDSEIFLIVTWAILLCTIIGPLGVGLLVRRVRRLENSKREESRDVLGVWGVR
ncbi:Sodium/hydrogen exchanger [Glonium stellatum]|uniref:Sodium/hydrogen exchanger n=1 Tax=Glonium stellatum TaxID=574774 RepID=A0A8E2EYX0_9PEZI|nr:Sodium/hydrogen exchanger [Glonium stellatum]